jgi:UDP-N-acetylglucosamine diphosphorylase/glucosamine-1-phosphate N-acetyltransferase
MTPKICFYEDDQYRNFFPLTHLRPVYTLRSGIMPLFKRVGRYIESPDICLSCRDALSPLVSAEFRDYPVNMIKRSEEQSVLFLNGRLRDYGDLVKRLNGARLITRLLSLDGGTAGLFFPLDTMSHIPLVASIDQYNEEYRRFPDDIAELDTGATLYRYCWDLVDDIEKEIAADFAFLQDSLTGLDRAVIHKGVDLLNPEAIHIGAGVEVLPGSLIDATHGPVFIGDNSRVESQVVINGPCYIGPNSVIVAGKITACSIGHTSRAGGEIEESIFQSYVNKYHAGFIGHSYVGSWVNFGAMTTNSDLKNNYSNIRVTINGEPVDSGSIKVGSFIGDHTKFGIGTLLNTGISIGVSCNLFGGSLIVDNEVPSFSWGNSSGYQQYRFDKAIETIRRSAARRNVTLSSSEEGLLQKLSEGGVGGEGTVSF